MPFHLALLPEWGKPILDFIAPRILVEVKDINCFPSRSRHNRKRLVQLTQNGFLKRFELTTKEKPIIAYSLGKQGIRETKIITPTLFDLNKAQELIVANKFILFHNITEFHLWVNKGLLIGEIKLEDKRFSLWCPRQPETRLKSLRKEIPLGVNGLIVLAPNLKHVYPLATQLSDIRLPIYFVVDSALKRFMRLEDGILVPV